MVDASVAFKWVIGREVDAERARALLDACVQSAQPLFCPPHLFGEVVNALYQRVRTREVARQITEQEAFRAVRALIRYPLRVASPPELYEQAFRLALRYSLPSIYDALYVVLAQLLGAELWTADQRLLSALGGNASWVRDISSYPLAP